jgi:hypothetical protein
MRFSVCIVEEGGPGQFSRYGDSLRVGKSGERIPVEEGFFPPVQEGHEAHPASCTMGTGSPSQGAKRPGRGLDNSPLEAKHYSYSCTPSPGPSWPILG